MDNEIKNSNLPKIMFGFDKEWEIENWYDSCIKNISYNVGVNTAWDLGSIPQDVKIVIKDGISEEKIKPKLAKILDNFLKTQEALSIIKKVRDKAESNWGKIDKFFFPALLKMLDLSIEEIEKSITHTSLSEEDVRLVIISLCLVNLSVSLPMRLMRLCILSF